MQTRRRNGTERNETERNERHIAARIARKPAILTINADIVSALYLAHYVYEVISR